ncbi:MAG: Crp/Fnr family transcriptional regulator [Rhodobacteraceae bacterium]|uniref:Crp/Fnr family transcriptional regulator n=1 Tax=Salipiger thiooxidans TaxID=282683 RepID=UPI001A8EBF21|nr:Crp/Fnr family transcriptional regulator [Salipiger thiooxidans]MBN8189759.1 Crp/Fnr family transcriptional regulator [Salipiger thiooxidans]MBR9840531.1 Crp/Fnr family transcriptional regulator [Paracoccaceae bacterium]
MVGHLDHGLWRRLDDACSGVTNLKPRTLLSRAGEPLSESALLLDGMMARYVAQPVGNQNKAMVSIRVPGDFVDLHALPLGHLDHDVSTLTDVTIAIFPHEKLLRIMAESADDARALWRLTMVDAAIHRHWIYRNARLRAVASIADFISEMDMRLRACGAVADGRMPLPLLQTDIADIAGLSTVHVSRVCRDLREAGLCTIADGHTQIHDRERLHRLANFDPAYLYPSGNLSS